MCKGSVCVSKRWLLCMKCCQIGGLEAPRTQFSLPRSLHRRLLLPLGEASSAARALLLSPFDLHLSEAWTPLPSFGTALSSIAATSVGRMASLVACQGARATLSSVCCYAAPLSCFSTLTFVVTCVSHALAVGAKLQSTKSAALSGGARPVVAARAVPVRPARGSSVVVRCEARTHADGARHAESLIPVRACPAPLLVCSAAHSSANALFTTCTLLQG
jgi:hypothetical protein